MKTVKVSARVAKLAWDQTVGGVRCDDALNRYRLGHSQVPVAGLLIRLGVKFASLPG